MKTRKIISILCAASMALAMTACDKDKETDTENSSKSSTATKASADESKTESTDPAGSAVGSDVSELSESQKESSSANDSVESKSKDSEAEISDDNTAETADDNAEENTASETGSDESDTMEVKSGGLIYHIPSNYFQCNDSDKNSLYYAYNTPDCTMSANMICYSQDFPDVEFTEEIFDKLAQGVSNSFLNKTGTELKYTPTEFKHNTILERNEYEIGYIVDSQSEKDIDYMSFFFIQGSDKKNVNYIVQFFNFKDHEIDYDYIADAAKIIYSIEEDPDFVD